MKVPEGLPDSGYAVVRCADNKMMAHFDLPCAFGRILITANGEAFLCRLLQKDEHCISGETLKEVVRELVSGN